MANLFCRWWTYYRKKWDDSRIDPRTAHFAEIARLRMDRDRNPLLPTLVDKLAVRAWAAERGVATAPLVWQGRRAQDIPWDSLPEDCFIKLNHGSGWNLRSQNGVITHYRDGRVPEDQRPVLTRAQAEVQLERWLHRNYSHREWAYTRVKRRIVIETPLTDRNADELQDLRFYVFAGKVQAANLGSPSLRALHQFVGWYPDGRRWDLTKGQEFQAERPFPPRWDELVRTAEHLAQGLDFVRVDLYDTTDGMVLGELTLYPEAGGPDSPSPCPVFNRWMGDCWRTAWDQMNLEPGRWRPRR